MSELIPHNPELQGKSFRLVCDPELIEDITYFSGHLQQPEEEFLSDAIDYMLLRHAIYKANAVLEAVGPDGLTVEHISDLDTMYPYEVHTQPDEPAEILLNFSGMQMQSLMLGCAQFFPSDIQHVSDDFGEWKQVSYPAYRALTKGACVYMSRLEAERDGWRLRINDNSGAHLPELEPIGENIRE